MQNIQSKSIAECALHWFYKLPLRDRLILSKDKFLTVTEIAHIFINNLCLSAYGMPADKNTVEDITFILRLENHRANPLLSKDLKRTVIIWSNMDSKEFFFSTDHCQPKGLVINDYWVPVTHYIPTECAPRKTVPKGIIGSVQDLINVFYDDYTEVKNPDENYIPSWCRVEELTFGNSL